MKLSYFADTDSLYIDLSEEPSVESREISEGVVLDYNASGRLVGIDIDEASKRVQMDKLVLSQLPSTVETAAAQGSVKPWISLISTARGCAQFWPMPAISLTATEAPAP